LATLDSFEEILMWEVFKTAIAGVKDALGIEIPELPIDLGALDVGSIGDAAAAATQGVTESATGAVDEAMATAGEAVTADAGGMTQTLSDASTAAVDAAAQGLPNSADVLGAGLSAGLGAGSGGR
jgi:hypothetical protein